MEGACGELWSAMKARLKDLNKNLAIQVSFPSLSKIRLAIRVFRYFFVLDLSHAEPTYVPTEFPVLHVLYGEPGLIRQS